MATITVRNLDDEVKEGLRIRAALRGHSMEEEARAILRQAVSGLSGEGVWKISRELFGGKKGVALEIPSRRDRAAPDLSA